MGDGRRPADILSLLGDSPPAPVEEIPPAPVAGDAEGVKPIVVRAGGGTRDILSLLASDDSPDPAPAAIPPPTRSEDSPSLLLQVRAGDGRRPADILSLLGETSPEPDGPIPPAPVADRDGAGAAPIVVRAGHGTRDILSLLEAAPEAGAGEEAIPPPPGPPAAITPAPLPLPGAPIPEGDLLRHLPKEVHDAKIRRFWLRRHRHAENARPSHHHHHHHRESHHLSVRPKADERFARRLTLAGAAVILPALLIGWRHLVPDEAQMVDRLVADGRLKEAAALANQIAEKTGGGGADYRFLAAAMLVEKTASGTLEERRAAFAQLLSFAGKAPDDTLAASGAARAMEKLAVCDGADAMLERNASCMPPHVIAIWVDALSARHLADGRPDEALRSALIGWDAAPGRGVSAEALLRTARQADRVAAITDRLRDHVVTGGHFDQAETYRAAMRETGREDRALRELWPLIMLRSRPADFGGLAKCILACGPKSLETETGDLLDRAIKAPELPPESGLPLIALCHSRGLLDAANALVDKLAAAGCESPEFLRSASRTKLWTDRPGRALEYIRQAHRKTGDENDFNEALRIATLLRSTSDIVGLSQEHGLARLDEPRRILYADSLVEMGDHEPALRAYLEAPRQSPETLAKIARLQRDLRRNEDALATYRRLVLAEPRKAEWRDREFRLLVLLGRNAEAALAAEAAWNELREPARLLDAMRAALAADDGPALARIAERAVEAAPTADPQMLLDACNTLLQARREAPRIAILSTLAQRLPERLDIARELAVHDFNLSRFDLVEARFAKTPALLESRENVALLLSARIATGNREAADALLDSALDKHREWTDHGDFAEVATHACLALRIGDTAGMLTDRFLAHPAGDLRFRILATRLLGLLGRDAEAVAVFNEMEGRLTPEMRVDYAKALASGGRQAEAEDQLLRVVAASPRPDPRTLSLLGDLRLSAGASEPAQEAYRHALSLLPKAP